jgi:hypothetical protein
MRLPSLSALLLAACAAPGEQRFVILESDSYGCGAVEGLGCGLAIAPVLEQIDALPGVEESSVSWDGRCFRIGLVQGADPDRLAAEAAALLEGEACCVTASRGKAAPATPDQWFDAERVVELSRHEALVIATDFMAEIETEVELQPEAREQLGTAIREELESAFEAAHAQGGGVHRLWEQLPERWPRFETRVVELLGEDRARAVLAVVERQIQE